MTVTRQFEHDLLRALQYLYYVQVDSPLSDYQFDVLQKAYEAKYETSLEVGSDKEEDYTIGEQYLACYIANRGLPIIS